MSNLSTTLRL